jgi:hypothetical protein
MTANDNDIDYAVAYFDTRTQEWVLAEDLWILIDRRVFRLPRGERANGWSVPRPFWWVISPIELGLEPAFWHDKAYEYQGVFPPEWVCPYKIYSRDEADAIQRQIAMKYGCQYEGNWRQKLKAVRFKAKVNAAYGVLRGIWGTLDFAGISRWARREGE